VLKVKRRTARNQKGIRNLLPSISWPGFALSLRGETSQEVRRYVSLAHVQPKERGEIPPPPINPNIAGTSSIGDNKSAKEPSKAHSIALDLSSKEGRFG
jgi:hypothetical protein